MKSQNALVIEGNELGLKKASWPIVCVYGEPHGVPVQHIGRKGAGERCRSYVSANCRIQTARRSSVDIWPSLTCTSVVNQKFVDKIVRY
jgi:hypothetical protein